MNYMQKARKVAVSVVAPCFNEEGSVGELVKRVRAVCQKTVGESYEIVLVNDGSEDNTWSVISWLAYEELDIVAVNLARNYGHQLALSAGLQVCSGDRILIIDADLQDPPELLPKMMKLMDAGADVVYGQRASRSGETAFKKATATAFYKFLNCMVDVNIPRETGDFRLMSRRTLDILNSMPENHRFIRGMVSWIGLRQEPLRYERQARFAGETNYPLAKMLRLAVDAITGFSTTPLRLASSFAVGGFIAAVTLILFAIYQWALGNVVPGWTSLILVVLILSSAQFIVLAVFGEYLGRLYMESKRRPLFIIDQIVHSARLNGGVEHSDGSSLIDLHSKAS